MSKTRQILATITGVGMLVGVIGCATLGGRPMDKSLSKAALHVMVNHEVAIPSSGTFDFDTKLFKVSYTEDVDLAAVDERIVAALEAELVTKGFQRDIKNPDVLISYAVAMDSAISAADFNNAYAKAFPINVPVFATGQELNYHQGTFIVDVVDTRSRKLLWRGAVMADVTKDESLREKERRTTFAVGTLLNHFPKPNQSGQ